MAEPLTPEEIDALLNSLKESTAGPVEPVASTPELAPIATAPAVPFGALSRTTSERLSPIAEGLRLSLERGLKPLLQLPFSLHVARLGLAQPDALAVTLLRYEPGDEVGALSLDSNIATAMADRLMGGQARPASRPLGELERAILTPVFHAVAEALTYALRRQGAQVVPYANEDARPDAALQVDLAIDINGLRGEIRIGVPNYFVNTEAPQSEEGADDDWTIELGSASLSAHAILDLKVGQIIQLDRHADASLVLAAGDKRYAGRPVLQGDRLLFSVSAAKQELN